MIPLKLVEVMTVGAVRVTMMRQQLYRPVYYSK
jgi:hypothetical protein